MGVSQVVEADVGEAGLFDYVGKRVRDGVRVYYGASDPSKHVIRLFPFQPKGFPVFQPFRFLTC